MDISTAVAAFLMQVGARHISFEMTEAQRKMMQNPVIKGAILFAMFFVTTKSMAVSIALTLVYFAMIYVLLNEKHKYNIFSRPWLKENGFMKNESFEETLVDIYKQNIETLLFD